MIQQVRIQHFRCLEDAALSLGPLTVLVGPNGSGKSSVLLALNPRRPVGDDARLHDRRVKPRIVVDGIEYFAPGTRRYTYQLVHWDLRNLREPNQVEQATTLETTGQNLTNVFASLTRAEQQRLVETFAALVPAIADATARPGTKGSHRLVFQDRWKPDIWFEPGEVSDGTILVLAYLTLAFQPHPVNLLAIEEPERGLHPYLLEQVVKLLRRLTAGDLGVPPIQIILATHSSELLAYVQPEEVRFLSRDPATGTVRIEQAPTDSPDWVSAYREYNESMGGMWLSGSLGGVPGGGR